MLAKFIPEKVFGKQSTEQNKSESEFLCENEDGVDELDLHFYATTLRIPQP
jgi:hypothetical protein